MRNCTKKIILLFAGAACIAVGACQNSGVSDYDKAEIYLSFDKTLENAGHASLIGEAKDTKVKFKRGANGRAMFAPGDGGWIEYRAKRSIVFESDVEISFDFRANDWVNPYSKGRSTRTIAVVSGQRPGRIEHIAFNLGGGNEPRLTAYFKNGDEESRRITTTHPIKPKSWVNVKLSVDRASGSTKFFVDGKFVGSQPAIPAAIDNGVSALKFGTWYKKNQAFRGRIDNFTMRSPSRASEQT